MAMHKALRGITPPREKNIIVCYKEDEPPVRIDLRGAIFDAALKADGDVQEFARILELTYGILPCLSLNDQGQVKSISYETRYKSVLGTSIKWHNSGHNFGIDDIREILKIDFGFIREGDPLWRYVRDSDETSIETKT